MSIPATTKDVTRNHVSNWNIRYSILTAFGATLLIINVVMAIILKVEVSRIIAGALVTWPGIFAFIGFEQLFTKETMEEPPNQPPIAVSAMHWAAWCYLAIFAIPIYLNMSSYFLKRFPVLGVLDMFIFVLIPCIFSLSIAWIIYLTVKLVKHKNLRSISCIFPLILHTYWIVAAAAVAAIIK